MRLLVWGQWWLGVGSFTLCEHGLPSASASSSADHCGRQQRVLSIIPTSLIPDLPFSCHLPRHLAPIVAIAVHLHSLGGDLFFLLDLRNGFTNRTALVLLQEVGYFLRVFPGLITNSLPRLQACLSFTTPTRFQVITAVFTDYKKFLFDF